MPAIAARAPGKAILFGEHAVVYGRPAIAVPLSQVQARAMVSALVGAPRGTVRIEAPDIGLVASLNDLPLDDPLATAVRGVLAALAIAAQPALSVRVTSTIPVASGLGSGAAVSVALIRALSAFLGAPLDDAAVCQLAYQVERIHHGTPSGIDNTVITYNKPVFFTRGQPIQTLDVPRPFTLLIAGTGIASPTALAVGDVRAAWQADTLKYEALFDAVGEIVRQAREAIHSGETHRLGALMDANHALLQQIGVSSPELDRLVDAAREAGAWGAKLSGGGRGGNMIALVGEGQVEPVRQALLAAGAVSVMQTQVG